MRSRQLENRRDSIRENFAEAVEHAIQIGADLFLHCGDLFDMSTPRNREVAFVADHMSKLENHGVKSFLVVGNHDMSLSGMAADSSPHSVFDSFDGPNIFLSSDEPESEEVEIGGETVQVSGLSFDPKNSGNDPLNDVKIGSDADWNILLTHYGIEGTLANNSDESVINRDTIKSLKLDLACSGHIHKTNELELSGTKTLVPGGTERLDFNESEYSTGFYVVEMDDEVETEYIELDSQSMESVEINIEEEENPQEEMIEIVEENSSDGKMLQLKVSGTVTREEYRDLDLHELWELGRQENFFFDLKDNIQLDVESGIQTDGERLSQKEELENVAEEFKDNNEGDAEIIEKAANKVVTDYREE
jgi:DNA repair exonuclease SbcCD nuclease subunit